jgi:hypothetical protein
MLRLVINDLLRAKAASHACGGKQVEALALTTLDKPDGVVCNTSAETGMKLENKALKASSYIEMK